MMLQWQQQLQILTQTMGLHFPEALHVMTAGVEMAEQLT